MCSEDVPEYLNAVLQRVVARIAERGFDQLTHSEQVFIAIMELLTQVLNGGFAQYMFNHHLGHGAVALGALQEVGAEAAVSLCEQLFRVLPGGRPADTNDERQKQLDLVSERFGESRFNTMLAGLDRRFYSQEGDVEEKLARYARQHLSS